MFCAWLTSFTLACRPLDGCNRSIWSLALFRERLQDCLFSDEMLRNAHQVRPCRNDCAKVILLDIGQKESISFVVDSNGLHFNPFVKGKRVLSPRHKNVSEFEQSEHAPQHCVALTPELWPDTRGIQVLTFKHAVRWVRSQSTEYLDRIGQRTDHFHQNRRSDQHVWTPELGSPSYCRIY